MICQFGSDYINTVKIWDWDEKNQPIDDYMTNCNEFNDKENDLNFIKLLVNNSYILISASIQDIF